MYAAKALQDLNVEIKLQTKVKEIRELSDGVQELALSDGSKVAADLYIPTFGLTPNTSYIPAKFLNDKGEVKVDKYMRVKGADGVFALGDVTDLEGAQLVICDRQSTYLAKALTAVLSNKAPSPYKPLSGRMYLIALNWKIPVSRLTDPSVHGTPNWQESRNRPMGDLEAPDFSHCLGAQGAIH